MFKKIKFLISLSMAFTFMPLMNVAANNTVEVTTADQMIEALKDEGVGLINVAGILKGATAVGENGNDEEYTVYTINRPVTISGEQNSKVQGTFMVMSPGVTIKNLSIENKGDLGGNQEPTPQHRGNIIIYAKNVEIYDNVITHGLEDKDGLANAIQIFSDTEDNSLSNYLISGNTIKGFNNKARGSASAAILIAEGYNSTVIGKKAAKTIRAFNEDYEKLLLENDFLNNSLDIQHSSWEGGTGKVLYENQADELNFEKAKLAVAKAEDSKTQEDVYAALILVKKLSEEKQVDFMARLDVVQTEIDQVLALETVELAVAKAEKSLVQADVDTALELVKKLPEAEQKKFTDRLNVVQTKIDEKEEDKEEDKEDVVLDVITDKKTGVKIESVGDTILPEGVKLVVSEDLKTLDEKTLKKFTLNVKEKTDGKEIVKLYDISLVLNGENIQPNGKVKLTLPIDETLKGYENLEVTYIDGDGKVTVIKSEVKDGEITFETDHFSYYAVIGTPKKVATETPDVPNTSIASSNYYYIGLVMVSLGVLFVVRKRRIFE